MKALIIGPGFIGWNVLELLVANGYVVTGYVRREEHAHGLRASGASDVVFGDLNDKALIIQHVAKQACLRTNEQRAGVLLVRSDDPTRSFVRALRTSDLLCSARIRTR